tara:strand:- start:744 stop:1094 length:351 start_codon:yes stop_codon:yes gene_type:complete
MREIGTHKRLNSFLTLIMDMVLAFGAGCAAALVSITRYSTMMRSWKAAQMYPITYMSSGCSGSVRAPALSMMASASGSTVRSSLRWISRTLKQLANFTTEKELEVPPNMIYNYWSE